MRATLMRDILNRRQFLGAGAVVGASLAWPQQVFAAHNKSVLVFTKSSGFEHDVVKTTGGKPSIVEQAVSSLGKEHGFDVTASKDGRIFDSKDFWKHAAVFFFTTGDLTSVGTDKNPAMSPQGKQYLPYSTRSSGQLEPLRRPQRTIRPLFAHAGR